MHKYTLSDIQKYSKKYLINKEDIIYILLNILGVRCNTNMPRIRANIRLQDKSEYFYFGLANNPHSPFHLEKDKVYFQNDNIAEIKGIENDDCASSYFRRNKTVLTINSNKRSNCRGCQFCPNNLELNSEDENLNTTSKLKKHFEDILKEVQKEDLSFLERITICTGCFKNEQETLDHILMVYDVVTSLAFPGIIHYIGSQIQTPDAFKKIRETIRYFMYTFTIECFSKRRHILRPSKAEITLNKYKSLMRLALKNGFIVNYIYILGIDSFSIFQKYTQEFREYTNYFPSINLFQPHELKHYTLCSKDANRLDYYLKSRVFLENLYADSNMFPVSWECYRPLWYYTFKSQKNTSIRI